MPIDPRELGIEATIETEPENEDMETARSGRTELFMNMIRARTVEVWTNPLIQKAINHTPYVGDAIMGYKIAKGEEGGRKLKAREKLLYAASITTSLAGIYYLYQGELTTAGLSSLMSESFSHIDGFISLAAKVGEKVKEIKPDLANFALATAELVSSKKEAFLKLKDLFDKSITQLELK